MPEYNPLEESKPSSAPVSSDSEPLGEGGIKALKAQREETARLEKEARQLREMLRAKEAQLAETNLTLEQKYQQETEQYKQSLLTEAQQAIAERDRKLQEIEEARLAAEQKLQAIEVQDAARSITNTFTSKIASLLVDPDDDVEFFLNKYADNLVYTSDGQVVAKDESGNFSPLEDLIQFFQVKHPRKFKAPEAQKKGGGFRNLANTGIPRTGNSQELELPPMGKITPEQFLANREAIAKGQFKVVKE